MPAYSKTTWVNGTTPAINATNLNKIEQGIADAVRKDGSEAMSAQLVTIAGTAATPAIAPTGDSNTGIFFPAADTIAFGEGGTEVMRIDSNSRVGIGAQSQGHKLDVFSQSGATNLARFVENSTQFQNFQINSTANGIRLVSSFSTGVPGNLEIVSEGGSSNLIFATNGAANERMRINSAGNVGIGINAPTSQLHVYNNGGAASSMVETNTTGGDAKIALKTNGTGGRHWYWQTGDNGSGLNGRLRLWDSTAGAERLTILDNGNVGIGTTSLEAKLHVTDSLASSTVVGANVIGRFQSAGSNADCVISFSNGVNSVTKFGQNAGNFVWLSDNTTERMRLTSGGYLLIGYTTSNGAYPLQVNGQIFATSSTIATSDGRYKKDIVSLDGALDIVSALNPVQFNWKEHPVHKFNTDVPTIGFIAQEVAEVLKDKAYLTSVIKKSECTWETETGEFVDKEVTKEVEREVTVDVVDAETGETTQQTQTVTENVTETIQEPVKEVHTEEFYGIAESNMIAILTKAIQELNAKVEALEAQLAGN
jgi:hypothetical protein